MVEPFKLPSSESTDAQQSMKKVKMPIQEDFRSGLDSTLVTEEVHGRRGKYSTVNRDDLDILLGKAVPPKAFEVEVVDSSCIPLVVPSVPSPKLGNVEKMDEDDPFQVSGFEVIKEELFSEEQEYHSSSPVDLGEHRRGTEKSNKELQKSIPALAMEMLGFSDRMKVGGIWQKAPDDLPAGVVWRSPNSAIKDPKSGKIINPKPLQQELIALFEYLISKVCHHAGCPCLIKLPPKDNVKKERKEGSCSKTVIKKKQPEKKKGNKRVLKETGLKVQVNAKRMKREEGDEREREPCSSMTVYRRNNVMSPLSSRWSESDTSYITESDVNASGESLLNLDPVDEEFITDACFDDSFVEFFDENISMRLENESYPDLQFTSAPDLEKLLSSTLEVSTDHVDGFTSQVSPHESSSSKIEFSIGTKLDGSPMEEAGEGGHLNSDMQQSLLEDIDSIIRSEMSSSQESSNNQQFNQPDGLQMDTSCPMALSEPFSSKPPPAILECLAYINGETQSYPQSDLKVLVSQDLDLDDLIDVPSFVSSSYDDYMQ